MHNQLKHFEAAAAQFPVWFERRSVELPYRGGTGTIALPVHLYSADGDFDGRPVLIVSAGVDTWKMDIHPWCVSFAMNAGVDVVAFDHPGTGETSVPLDRHADEVIAGIAQYAKEIGDGRVAHFAASFGRPQP